MILCFRNDRALYQLAHGVPGVSGQPAQFHVAVQTLSEPDSTHAPVKSIPILNFATLIHAPTMELGLIGLPARPHAVLEPCPEFATATVVKSARAFV